MAVSAPEKSGQKVDRSRFNGGVVKIVGQTQLPQEFITIGRSFEDALGRCTLRDDQQRNDVIIYKAQLEMFNKHNELEKEIEDLTSFLNASAAVGGFNRSLAAMTHTGIYVPEGAGIKVSKENQRALMEMQKQRSIARGRETDNGNGQQNNNQP